MSTQVVFLLCVTLGACFSNAVGLPSSGSGSPRVETGPGEMLNQLLQFKICEEIPSLPSCIEFNNTLEVDNRLYLGPRAEGSPSTEFITLALDYVAATQKTNADLRHREEGYLTKIAKLEHTKEQLEGQVRALEADWLPVVERSKESALISHDGERPDQRSSMTSTSYQPTASVLRPVDCADYLTQGAHKSGVYDIYPFRCKCSEPVKVWCDMETDGGGWTVILNRQKTSNPLNFTQPWEGYKTGFGNASTEYWIGNENLHLITSTRLYSLRLDFEETGGNFRWAEWPKFMVHSEKHKYKLDVPSFNTYSMIDNCMVQHNGKFFSTFDNDNDASSGNCAETKKAGWWYNNCASLDPTTAFKSDGNIYSACTYKVNNRNVHMIGPSLQLKIRPQVCSEMVKAVYFNSHTCMEHNGSQ